MDFRFATPDDVSLLAELNHQLIEDEGSANSMSVAELASRMLRWLEADYRAVLFEVSAEPVAYLLYRPSEDGIYVRQLFVCRGHRRRGYGGWRLTSFAIAS